MKTVANTMDRGSEKLFNFRPMLFAAIFLSLGIAFSYLHMSKGLSLYWAWGLLPVGVLPLLFATSLKNLAIRCGVCLVLVACFLAGGVCFYAQLVRYADISDYSDEVIVTGRVENRKLGEYTAYIELGAFSIDGEGQDGVLALTLPRELAEELRIADCILLRGEISKATEGFNPTLVHKTLRYRMECEEYSDLGRSTRADLLLRSRMERVLYAGMDETPAALTLGLLTGDMSGVDGELVDNMRLGGISHLFAVSGLNVGALFAFCLLLFQKTPLRRTPKPLRFLLLVGLLGFYAAVCGFSASVVRATLLCLIGYFLRLSNMGTDMLETLGLSAIFILLFSPCQLFDVGFQLSFAACFGLVLLTKPIGQVFDEIRKAYRKRIPVKHTAEEEKALAKGDTLPKTVRASMFDGIKVLLSATIAAQLATLPLLLIHFGFASGWGLLLNCIFVPLIDGIFTGLLLITLFACCLSVSFSSVLLYLPSLIWWGLILLFEVADFSSFAIEGVKLTAGSCCAYFLGLTFLSDKWNLSKRWRVGIASVLLVAAIGLTLLVNC